MRLQLFFSGAAALSLAAVMTVTPAAQADLAQVTKLRNPAAMTEQAPATYKANIDTSKGTFVIQVHRDWASMVIQKRTAR